jgi:hypothetical protein
MPRPPSARREGWLANMPARLLSRDPATGDFRDGAVLAQFGDVDLDALSA